MVISGVNIDFQILRIYVEAYVTGLGEVLNINLMPKIIRWFQNKVNQKASVVWTSHIEYLHKDRTDDELKVILLDVLKEFFIETPNWNNEYSDR